MADPFGIIGVIGVATQIIQVGVQLGLNWKDAPSDARNFLTELQTFKTILSETNTNIVLNPAFAEAFNGHHSALLSELSVEPNSGVTSTQSMLSNCKHQLDLMLEDLNKRAKGHRVGWERLKGAFLSKRTREAVEDLHRQCQSLNTMASLDSVDLAVRTYSAVSELGNQQAKKQVAEEDQAILDWITPIDYLTQQNDALNQRQAGTGEWFLASTQYQNWVGAAGQTLFCQGMPGAGKTVIVSTVVEDLTARFQNEHDVGIAYLYCNFRRQKDQTAQGLLATLLKQLVQSLACLPDAIISLYQRHKAKRTQPSIEEITKSLSSVIGLYSKTFIIVDALDECNNAYDYRGRFLTEIMNLHTKTGFNMMATARPITEIVEIFNDSILLEIRASDQDVRKYLNHHLVQLSRCIARNPELQSEIKQAIVQVVDGMFLLAQLSLESLKGKTTPKAVRKALANLPSGSKAYDRAYDIAMERIEGQLSEEEELAKQVLSWISCAKRPLTVIELEHALAVEIGERELDEENNITPIDDMVSLCVGLVVVDKGSKVVRLIHYTAQQYFERTKERWFPDAELEITRTCATYLSFNAFKSGSCNRDPEFNERLQLNPLFNYAACNWGHHARQASTLCQEALDFLRLEKQVEASHEALIAAVGESRYGDLVFIVHLSMPRTTSSLHLSAYFGVNSLVSALIDARVDIDVTDVTDRTPLHYAAQQGHEAIIRLLLATNQVNVDSKAFDGLTPLSIAAGEGHETVVKLLISMKVDVDSKDDFDQTPLLLAATYGHKAVVELLLATSGVNVNSKDIKGRTPLLLAAKHGHEAVVELLLATNQVNIDSKDDKGQTPLSISAQYGHEGVVMQLLAMDQVDIESKSDDGRTPLHYAVQEGHVAVIKLLLATKVDTNARDTDSRTPLHYAVHEYHKAVVEMLLAIKVDANVKDIDSRTPLHCATNEGYETVVKMLLAINVDANVKDVNGETPLHCAIQEGYVAVVKLLLDTNQVNVNAKTNKNCRTPLHFAAHQGHEAIIKLLLIMEVDIDSRDVLGRTPLSYAAERGHGETVKLLLAKKADVNAKDDHGRTPLSYAVEENCTVVMELLLATNQIGFFGN